MMSGIGQGPEEEEYVWSVFFTLEYNSNLNEEGIGISIWASALNCILSTAVKAIYNWFFDTCVLVYTVFNQLG